MSAFVFRVRIYRLYLVETHSIPVSTPIPTPAPIIDSPTYLPLNKTATVSSCRKSPIIFHCQPRYSITFFPHLHLPHGPKD